MLSVPNHVIVRTQDPVKAMGVDDELNVLIQKEHHKQPQSLHILNHDFTPGYIFTMKQI